MKKILALFMGVLAAILMLPCSVSYAAVLTPDEIAAQGDDVSEQDRIDTLNYYYQLANPDKDIPTVLHLDEGVTVDDRKLNLSFWRFCVNKPDGTLYENLIMDITGSWLNIADDVVFIEETDDNWFNETGPLAIGGSESAVHSNIELTEGAPVLILETNGDLHGFYAAADTDETTLVLGDPMNAYRGISNGHYESGNVAVVNDDSLTYDFGPTFPLCPIYETWGENQENYFETDLDPTKSFAALHFNFDIDWGFGWVELDANDISVEFAYNNNHVHLESENSWAKSITLFSMGGSLADVLNFGGDVFISFEGSGKGDTHFAANIKEGYYVGLEFSILKGIECTKVGWIDDRNFDITDTDAVGEVYVAYGEGPYANIADVVGLSADFKAGFVIDGETSKNHEYPGEPDTWHACDDEECICGNSHMRLGPLSLSATIFDEWSYTLAHTDPSDADPFMHYYVSKTFGDKDMDDQCPHKGYKINAEVVNGKEKALEGVTVSYKDVPSHFDPVASGETGDDGKTTLYAPPGSYEVTAELVSPRDPSIKVSQTLPIEKDTSIQDLKFTLDIPTKYVYFKNSSSGEASNWPKDIDFEPFYSVDVQLPNTIPSMSGRQFIGWNTKKDGTGTSYAPGATITTDEDVTLWAQWEVINNSWYVIYNANGGTKAPGPQIVRKGEDAVITMEVPEAGRMIFKGWTTDPNNPTPEYQRGDTLPYDSEKSYVVLYALWDLSPVPEPIHISFDANGVDSAKLPPDMWFERGTWAQLKAAEAPLGSPYAFLGWSEDPNATEPEYEVGQTYLFERDTQLYAIWVEQDTVTLTFADPLPDPASDIPEPISILTTVSPHIQIPDTIPTKSGRYFIGWNTEPDGSGTAYAPGSVVTMTGDLTLWAQWDVAGGSWYVIYNANGGDKAPLAQVITQGEDAVLTMELPEAGALTFKGWALSPDASEADYQPGDTLPYDSSRNYVVLYALWELSPAERPVLITFDKNGGETDKVPDPISRPRNVEFALPETELFWDPQHDFLGWSEDPNATEATWKPGGLATFDQDTTLHAIWYPHYLVIEGADSVWTKGSGKSQRFVADGNFTYYRELRVDGTPVSEDVQLSSGSTVADFSANAMEELSVGEHTVTFVYMDGEASAKFYVETSAPSLPETGDTLTHEMYLTPLVLSIAGFALFGAAKLINTRHGRPNHLR